MSLKDKVLMLVGSTVVGFLYLYSIVFIVFTLTIGKVPPITQW